MPTVTQEPPATGALVARARDIIAGRVVPPALVPPPEVVAFLESERASAPASPAALRHLTSQLTLQVRYAGRAIACFVPPGGEPVVLAVGDTEIEELLRALTEAEGARVVVYGAEAL
jgi:hypothetical protein